VPGDPLSFVEQPRRVLLVEDSRTVAFALRGQLEASGLQCDVCYDLASGLLELEERDYQLVLLDLLLPDVRGLDGLIEIKRRRPDLAVVILTGHDDSELAVQALQAGAQDYLVKGQHGQLLLRTLTFAYERNQVRMELDRLATELRSKNDQLEALNREKDHFLGMAAHDLRNPLSVIVGLSSLLLEQVDGVLNADQVDSLQHIEKSSGFMRRLIDDLLDISAIESGHLELELVDLDLEQLVSDHVAVCRGRASAKSIDLRFDGPETVVAVHADGGRLVQVLDNLVSNAIKYSEPGSVARVILETAGGDAVVSVIDQGPGIAASEQERLFQPFERASSRTTGGERSTGLGLAIAKRIVTAHGGRIGLSSALGEGSTFRFSLPLVD